MKHRIKQLRKVQQKLKQLDLLVMAEVVDMAIDDINELCGNKGRIELIEFTDEEIESMEIKENK